MKVNKWVAVLATGLVLAAAAPVSAQFGGLGSLKKKLETVAKELEKPKPAPQPQPTARPTPPRAPAPIAAPIPAQQTAAPQLPYEAQAPATKVIRLGSDFPRDMRVVSGPMPAFIKNSLETVTSCALSTGTTEEGNPLVSDSGKGYGFEMVYNPNTNSVDFGQFDYSEYPSSDPRYLNGGTIRSTFSNAFENIGVDQQISKMDIKYAGYDNINFYFQLSMQSEDKVFLINLFVKKDWMEFTPVISGKFSNNWDFTCDNPENNG